MMRSSRVPLLQRLKKISSDDSMSIALFSLFLICIASQSLSGWFAYKQALQESHAQKISYGAYLRTGNFLDGAISNWQAAVLQLAVLITFSSVLHQKGAAHSRKLSSDPGAWKDRTLNWNIASRPVTKGWLYGNSFSIAFFTLFLVTFVLHIIFGCLKYNEDQALRFLPPISLDLYFVSSGFWFSVFQTWEAEFLAIALYVVLSIFLRQEGSPESKQLGASNQETGSTYE